MAIQRTPAGVFFGRRGTYRDGDAVPFYMQGKKVLQDGKDDRQAEAVLRRVPDRP